jgi:hypothetical protein
MTRHCAIALALALAACGGGDDDDDNNTDTGDDGADDGGDGNQVCYDVPINTTNDGREACGPNVCAAGQYCVSDVGICDPGCLDELNCPRGQFCDLSNAPSGVGLCDDPGPEHEVACTGGDDCIQRCVAKAATCGAPADVASSACDVLCPLPDDQLECIEDTSCEELEQLLEGESVCGIGGG